MFRNSECVPVRMVGVNYDISSLKKAEAQIQQLNATLEERVERRTAELNEANRQLRQAQKLEALGTLAGGIAHDFNNILSSLLGNTELSQLNLPKDHPTQKTLKSILAGINRAKSLVSQILTFCRQSEQERTDIHLETLLKEAVTFLRASIPKTIDIKLDISDRNLVIFADPTQIHQVLMNLCTNAVHAIGHEPGKISIHLSRLSSETKNPQMPGTESGDPFVQLTVTDNGPGIPPNKLDRIFEPFYTTKAPGQGTGLGLSVVHGIVNSHNGTVSVENDPTQGTTFHVCIPMSPRAAVKSTEPKQVRQKGSGQRILIVDDEETLVATTSEILQHLGYWVVSYTDPQEAIEAFAMDPNQIDLVITDFAMPKLNGMNLAQTVRELKPEIAIIITTGYLDYSQVEVFKATNPLNEVVFKPASSEALGSCIYRLLHHHRSGNEPL